MKKLIFSSWSLFTMLIFLFTACQKDELVPNSATDASLETRSGYASIGTGQVYTMSNDASGNEVIVFSRDSRGFLQPYRSFPTGGSGNSGGLGSQGAIIVHGRFLFAVNAGSNTITSFIINGSKLQLIGSADSKGTMPISVTAYKDILYVVNAGGDGNIAGFDISPQGELSYIEGSMQPLSSSGVAPGQISFNPWGTYLVVSEKASNMLTVYKVNKEGIASAPSSYPSAGMTPFGFGFTQQNRIIVSEAFGGAPNGSAMSSYQLGTSGSVSTINGPVYTHQTAACWVAVTDNGKYAYTTNFGSNNVSGYRVGSDGAIELLNASGITGMTGAGPLDMAMSRNSQYLYILNANDDNLTMFKVNHDGSLTNLGNIGHLPASAVGLAAR